MPRVRPVIGITGPDRGGGAAWLFTAIAVRRAGGRPVRIMPSRPATAEKLDGLIIGGGADVSPELYGEEKSERRYRNDPPRDPSLMRSVLDVLIYPLTFIARFMAAAPSYGRIDTKRDDLELSLLKEAIKKKIPILGICRGEQLINVFFGGTLHQDLRTFYVEDPAIRTILPRRRIKVMPGSKLEAILGSRPGRVNALHAQGINHLGQDLKVAATDANGIIYAIEHERDGFILGVQWHPEFMPQVGGQQRIFEEVVRRARPTGN